MGFFDELMDFNEALVEEEMDYEYFQEHYSGDLALSIEEDEDIYGLDDDLDSDDLDSDDFDVDDFDGDNFGFDDFGFDDFGLESDF